MFKIGTKLNRLRRRVLAAVPVEIWNIIGLQNAIIIYSVDTVAAATDPVATGGINQITITG